VTRIALKYAFVSSCILLISAQFCLSTQLFHPARRDFLVGYNPVNAALLDYNLDGNTDAVVLSGREEGMLLVFRGTEKNELERAWASYCGNTPTSLAVMDLNRDELPDIIVSLRGDGIIRTFYGNPSGQFTTGISYSAGTDPKKLKVGDIDDDGEEEIVVSSEARIFIFERTTLGELIESDHFPFLHKIIDYDLGDVNGDGFMDFAIAFQGEGSFLFYGDANDLFSHSISLEGLLGEESGAAQLRIADFDLDGYDDILALSETGERFHLLWGEGSGNLRKTSIEYSDFSGHFTAVGPVGEEGLLDIISVSRETGAMRVHTGRICGARGKDGLYRSEKLLVKHQAGGERAYCFVENGGEYRCGQATVWADYSDFDRDSHPDIITLNQGSGTMSVFFGTEDGKYKTAPSFSAGPGEPGAKSVAVVDANEDGYNDVAVAYRWEDAISILLGDGEGNLEYYKSFTVGGSGTHTLAVGDLNEDDHEDIVVRNVTSSTVSVLLGDGSANYQLIGEYPTDVGTHLVTLTDVNLDAHLDVITPNARGGTVSILLGDGTGHLEHLADISVGEGPHSCVPIDYNKDGMPDLATANTSENSVSILLNDSGMLNLVEKIPVGKQPISICAGDFNEDGYEDLATANIEGLTISILLGDGSSSFQPQETYLLAGRGPHYVVPADLDQDGHLDLVSPVTGMDGVVVLYGDGEGNFVRNEHVGVGDNPNTVSIGDIDGDMMADIVTGNVMSSDVSLLINTATYVVPLVENDI
jgi:hypothetical protein